MKTISWHSAFWDRRITVIFTNSMRLAQDQLCSIRLTFETYMARSRLYRGNILQLLSKYSTHRKTFAFLQDGDTFAPLQARFFFKDFRDKSLQNQS